MNRKYLLVCSFAVFFTKAAQNTSSLHSEVKVENVVRLKYHIIPMKTVNPSYTFALLCFLVGLPGYQPYENVTHLLYNPTTHVCCNDKLFDIKSGTLCCGNIVIDPSTHQCCHGVPQPIKPSFACCNKELYNTATKTCCYDLADRIDRIVEPDGGSNICCKGQLYNYDTQICYNGVITSKVNTQCCDNKLINLNEKMCCYNATHSEIVVKRYSRDDICYRNVAINLNNQLMCDDVVVENPTGTLECCRKDLFDKSKGFLCCQTSNSTKIVSKSVADNDDCCGETTYNTAKGICCNYGNDVKNYPYKDGNLRPYCCGSGIVYPDADENYCEDKMYDAKKQTTCMGFDGIHFNSKIFEEVDASCCGINA